MFENLKNAYIADRQQLAADIRFYIENGYYPTWAEERRNNPDAGIKAYSTATRWEQYQAGKISREKAVEFAVKRSEKQAAADTEKQLAHLEEVAAAPDISTIRVDVIFNKNRYWGYIPHAEVVAGSQRTFGMASGCGYDKQSAAVASAFNDNLSILKVLYILKEKAIAEGKSDFSESACTGRDNRYCIGYGAGYDAIPKFEGGVGVECYWAILKAAGFETECHYGKVENMFFLHRSEKAGAVE